MKLFSIFALALTMGANLASAQEAPKPDNNNSTLNTIKEIFLKGSIDGKSLWVVLGTQDAAEHLADDVAPWVVTEDDLDAYQERGEKLVDHVYNSEHDDDFVDATKEGVKAMKRHAPRILERPWRSLKEIPKAFEVDLANGRDAFAKSRNQVAGALKFSGWAAWACIEGSYYLVIEAPIRFAMNLIATTTAVPFMWAAQTTIVAWDVLCLALRSVKIAIKAAVALPWAALVSGYSLLSSTTATAVTLVTAGVIATYKGARFVLFEAPRRIFYPLTAKVKTDIEFNDKEQEDLGTKLATYYSAANNDLGITRIESNIGHYSSKMKLFTKNNAGQEIQFGVLKVSIVEAKVRVRMDVKRGAFKEMKGDGLTRDEIRTLVSNSIEKAVKASVAPNVTISMQ